MASNRQPLEILFEDNHLIAINKRGGDLTQGDQTGDEVLPDLVKAYIKQQYNKPGSVFLGVIHRLDRPSTGVVLFAKTTKGLSRMTELFRERGTQKTYWILVEGQHPGLEGTAIDFLAKNAKLNKSFVTKEGAPNAKKAILHYKTLLILDRYTLLEIQLETGRHHQIRAQMAAMGLKIKGDLKYGAARPNPDGSIHLHARKLAFQHPIKNEQITIVAPCPQDALWQACETHEKSQKPQ